MHYDSRSRYKRSYRSRSRSRSPRRYDRRESPRYRRRTRSPPRREIKPATYETIVQVGEGTYGKVFKGKNQDNKLVALKRVRIEREKEGFPITALREIKILQSLSHENVVALLDLAAEKDALYIIFEYMEHDLAGIIHHPSINFTHTHIRSLARQMFNGLDFLHSRGIIHRDLKGSNLLLNRRGILKLADFGLARQRREGALTNRVITLWYRPIELLLGATDYDSSIDMWSAGCILLELFLKRPPFPGTDEISQIETVYKICGSPDPVEWVGCSSLPWFEMLRPQPPKPRQLMTLFKEVPPDALKLSDNLLQLNPKNRPTARKVLRDQYFTRYPLDGRQVEELLSTLKEDEDWHEFESKKRRKNRKQSSESPVKRVQAVKINASGSVYEQFSRSIRQLAK